MGALYRVIETVFFKESRPDLQSIMSGPVVGVDLGRHHRLATSAAQVDYVAPADSGPSDVGEGTLRWMGRRGKKEEEKATFGPRGRQISFVLAAMKPGKQPLLAASSKFLKKTKKTNRK